MPAFGRSVNQVRPQQPFDLGIRVVQGQLPGANLDPSFSQRSGKHVLVHYEGRLVERVSGAVERPADSPSAWCLLPIRVHQLLHGDRRDNLSGRGWPDEWAPQPPYRQDAGPVRRLFGTGQSVPAGAALRRRFLELGPSAVNAVLGRLPGPRRGAGRVGEFIRLSTPLFAPEGDLCRGPAEGPCSSKPVGRTQPEHSPVRESSGADCAAYQNPPGCSFDCAVASRLRKRDTPHRGEQRSSRPGLTSLDDSPFETLLVFPPQH
jgi:hypothetical protein